VQYFFFIADLRLLDKSYKFADLRFADWHFSGICGFAIADEPKNLRIWDLRNSLLARLWQKVCRRPERLYIYKSI
jgi:hypothetical protein